MKTVFLSLILALSLTASAANHKLGSQCGLTDTNESDVWIAFGKSYCFPETELDIKKIKALPTLTKQQIIITAKHFARNDENAPEIKNTVDAVKYFQDSYGVCVSYHNIYGKRVTQVMTYPGDNPYSVIFETGTRHVVAYAQDGTIICK